MTLFFFIFQCTGFLFHSQSKKGEKHQDFCTICFQRPILFLLPHISYPHQAVISQPRPLYGLIPPGASSCGSPTSTHIPPNKPPRHGTPNPRHGILYCTPLVPTHSLADEKRNLDNVYFKDVWRLATSTGTFLARDVLAFEQLTASAYISASKRDTLHRGNFTFY